MIFLHLRSANSGPAFQGTNQNDTLLWDVTERKFFVGPGSGGGSVVSVFGRAGVVTAQSGDYDSDEIDNVSSVAGASVSDALETLDAEIAAIPAAPVTSVFGRAGAVVAATNDYTIAQLGGTFAGQLSGPATAAVVTGITETSGPTALTFGAIADTQVLARAGGSVIGVTAIVGPADPSDNGKIPRASAGNFVYLAGAPNDLLVWNGAQWLGASLVDANVSATAAIAGTKISPDFGAQNVVTTGNFVTTGGAATVKTAGAVLQLGLNPGSGAGSAAATGNIRAGSSFSLVGLNSTNVTDRNILAWDASISQLTIGGTASFNILYQASASHLWGIAGVTKFSVVSTEIRPAVPLVWSNGTTASISQADMSAAGTAGNLSLTAQNNSNAGATVGGDVVITGGSCTNAGAVTSQQAGSTWIQSGTFAGSSGTRAYGSAGIRDAAGGKVVEVSKQNGGSPLLGFFAAAPVVKQTLTDTSGGVAANTLVDVTTTAVADPTKVNANFASIWTKINAYGLWS